MARRTQRVSSHPCRLPAEVSSRHESSVEARLAEGRGRFAADVKSIDAEGDDRLLLREFANPFVHALRITPDSTRHDFVRATRVVLRTGVDDLHRRARGDHRPDFLNSYR